MTHDPSLSGRVVLVTGASRGLGREMALALAGAGSKLCITATSNSDALDQTARELTELAESGHIHKVTADVTSEVDVERTVTACLQHFGRIDVLINNAGRGMRLVSETFNTKPTKFWECPAPAWSRIVDINVNGPFLMARAVVPHMLTQNFGKIINISTSDQTMVRAGYSPYGPSKALLEAASRVWAQDLSDTGVDVNVLLPGGAADTDLLPTSPNKKGADGNLLSPAVMRDPILWLASDQSNGSD